MRIRSEGGGRFPEVRGNAAAVPGRTRSGLRDCPQGERVFEASPRPQGRKAIVQLFGLL